MNFELTNSYDYDLPSDLIANTPAPRRSASRFLVGDVANSTFEHLIFSELPAVLRPDDLLVFNDARVVAARILTRKETGGAVELFVTDVLEPHGPDRWETAGDALVFRCMTKSSKALRPGQILRCAEAEFTVIEWASGQAVVRTVTDRSPDAFLAQIGEVPLPPYILRRRAELGLERATADDRVRYQTVYARKPGAVAAPTAGLHFDDELLGALDAMGVRRTALTLDVGPGTFRPVATERLSGHVMHTETYEIGDGLADAIADTKRCGGRVVAVGTTAVRALEADARRPHPFEAGSRSTDIFITPGFRFEVVDALITNFHLPRSTLLALVYALGGAEFVRNLYDAAVLERYRFYSYGDAMFLEKAAS